LLRLYLDSSIVVKRYVTELGTPVTDFVFEQAEREKIFLALSLWNIGEALGVFDERRRRGWLSEDGFLEVLKAMANELVKLMHARVLEAIPILAPILVESWNLVLNHHIYEADALQLTTCAYSQSDAFLSGDEKLVKICRKLGLRAFNVVKEENELKKFIEKSQN
jgi:predicted nucleic acid-binding protein